MLGFIVNGFIIILFLAKKILQTRTNTFILSLTISHFFFLSLFTPSCVLNILMIVWKFRSVCIAFVIIPNIIIPSLSLHLLYFYLDKFFYIYSSFKHELYQKRKNSINNYTGKYLDSMGLFSFYHETYTTKKGSQFLTIVFYWIDIQVIIFLDILDVLSTKIFAKQMA